MKLFVGLDNRFELRNLARFNSFVDMYTIDSFVHVDTYDTVVVTYGMW